MVRVFALVLLVCALVVPRAAWSAHLAGHENLTSQLSVHSHQSDHGHEHEEPRSDGVDVHAVDETGGGDAHSGGLTHDHSPSLSLASAWLMADDAAFETWPAPGRHNPDRTIAPNAHSRPESVLRPPRAA